MELVDEAGRERVHRIIYDELCLGEIRASSRAEYLAIIEGLAAAGVHVDVFSDIAPDPDYAMVEAGIERLRTSGAQAVLAVGGGSPLDCAKVLNLSHANGCHPSKLTGLWLFALPRKRGLPFYAVPTTAGSGSEVTMAAVVSDHAAQSKRTIVDPKTLPDMVALDPSFTVGLRPSITAPTALRRI